MIGRRGEKYATKTPRHQVTPTKFNNNLGDS